MTSLEKIEELERQLEAAKQTLAAELYAARTKAGMSLTQVARNVRVSAPTVFETEKGRRWNPRTVGKLVRFFERKANGQAASTAT
jgi:DNA-binding transcriptional regulator YiaG